MFCDADRDTYNEASELPLPDYCPLLIRGFGYGKHL